VTSPPFLPLLASVLLSAHLVALAASPLPGSVAAFIEAHCANCHDEATKEAGLDLTALAAKPLDRETLAIWIAVHDRAESGEMPPKKKERPPADALRTFLEAVGTSVTRTEQAATSDGRAIKRRLNRYEYENTVRDLLELPYLPVRDSLPEDATAHGYNKVGEALDVSHVQVARYLRTAEHAVREAIAPVVTPPARTTTRYHTWLQRGFNRAAGPDLRRTFPIVGHELQLDIAPRRNPQTGQNQRFDWIAASKPERREQEAVVMLMSTYEPAEIQFNAFRAPITARYRLRLSGYTVWMAPNFKEVTRGRRTEPVVIYAQTPPRSLRRLGAFDWGPDPSVHEIEVWLHAGETIQPDAARLVRSRPPDFKNPFLERDGMPGVAFQWLEVDGPLIETWPTASHRLLFDDLPIANAPVAIAKGAARPDSARAHVEITSPAPAQDAERLLRRFLPAAYRRPVADAEVQRFTGLVQQALKAGHSFTDAMVAGYTAVLSSPGFIYLAPTQGTRLDAYAVAERLAYFLWNSPPDETLRQLAASGKLLEPATLRQQVDRLLDDPRSRRFVDAFLDYWLDLRKMAASGPDAELYPEYQLDDLLTESMPEETQLFFAEMLRRNLPARTVVASDFAMLNERLATLYSIPDVTGVHFRPVPLPADSVRGGLITNGSVLKVTANGTTTSPVMRGVWITERILGLHTPPPPASVPAVESDIRGATTIREQLARHRAEESCNSCHRKIDPPGFALENFDVMGGWRTRYRATHQGQGDKVPGFGHDGLINKFLLGLPVDASGELPDGRSFKDIRGFRTALLANETQLAENLARQFTLYATGAPLRFSDRAPLAKIVAQSRASGYGVRTLIHELVQSELFLNK
jgi:hypothetical protein